MIVNDFCRKIVALSNNEKSILVRTTSKLGLQIINNIFKLHKRRQLSYFPTLKSNGVKQCVGQNSWTERDGYCNRNFNIFQNVFLNMSKQ